MPDGNHEVRTAWGFLAVRLPLPEDKQWAADVAPDAGRLAARRDKMIKTCNQCHSVNFAKHVPTVVVQKLFVMYLEHRMRTFQGTFPASPD